MKKERRMTNGGSGQDSCDSILSAQVFNNRCDSEIAVRNGDSFMASGFDLEVNRGVTPSLTLGSIFRARFRYSPRLKVEASWKPTLRHKCLEIRCLS